MTWQAFSMYRPAFNECQDKPPPVLNGKYDHFCDKCPEPDCVKEVKRLPCKVVSRYLSQQRRDAKKAAGQ